MKKIAVLGVILAMMCAVVPCSAADLSGNIGDYFDISYATGYNSSGTQIGVDVLSSAETISNAGTYQISLSTLLNPNETFKISIRMDNIRSLNLTDYYSFFETDLVILTSYNSTTHFINSLNKSNINFYYNSNSVSSYSFPGEWAASTYTYIKYNYSINLIDIDDVDYFTIDFFITCTENVSSINPTGFIIYFTDFTLTNSSSGVNDFNDVLQDQNQYENDVLEQLPEPNFQLNLIEPVFDEYFGGFIIARSFFENILSIRPIYVIIVIVLFVGAVTVILRYRKR